MPSNLFGQPVSKKGEILGCSSCPMDKVPGVRKVLGLVRIKQRRAMLWVQSPGSKENEKGLELVGQSGELTWNAVKPLGLSRDSFDIQNVMRCYPVDASGNEHEPSKRELQCCAPYNDEALQKNAGSAVVHMVMGDVAGTALFGKEFRKDRPIFWYAPWDAYVVLNWHPSFILRQGGEKAGWDYHTWKDRFRAVKACLDHPGRWGYIKSRKHKIVRTIAEFDEMERAIRSEQRKKRRTSFDIEDGFVDGKNVLLIAGFGTGAYQVSKDENFWQGQSYSVVLDHPQANYPPSHLAHLRERTKKLVEDSGIVKSLQNGSYDTNQCKALLGARLRGYEYDTQYGTFLRYSFLRSCSLENLTYRFFPEFADYKETTTGYPNFADCPIDLLCLRNGGDCEITQRLEQRFSPEVSNELVRIYCHVGKTLDGMENRGPLLDWPNWEKAKKIVPEMLKKLDRQLAHISGEPDFNCKSDQQVAWLVYDILKIPQIEEFGRSTQKDVLETLMAQTGNRTLELIQKRRVLGKIESTYLDGYANSAKAHEGELWTRWFLTGAVSTRLRSGGDGQPGFVNLQNMHGNPLLQNLVVADVDWRKALEE